MTLANYNDIAIGPVTIHMYGLMIALGFIAAYIMTSKRAKNNGLDDDVIWGIFIGALVGGLLGTKILYYIVSIPDIINDISILWDFKNGYVVYGGIIGGVIAAYFVCKRHRVNFLEYFDLTMPAVSLGQAFGRLGCTFAGCCYGRETDCIAHITYESSSFAPNGVALIPTQLISSAGNLLIMILLLIFSRKNDKEGRVGALYFILYGIGRFGVEFLRNDYRGSIGVLSTSQFISCILVVVGILAFIWFGRDKTLGNRWEGMKHIKSEK
ncbi:MAG: prolipoprotein diacylglyceryl transferase [Lachnospiraceae bacterium]|nr:prolipoprotein diacylglyceryl transferase [Lachnospiraceae bacterium]